jgi:hypothetical protein
MTLCRPAPWLCEPALFRVSDPPGRTMQPLSQWRRLRLERRHACRIAMTDAAGLARFLDGENSRHDNEQPEVQSGCWRRQKGSARWSCRHRRRRPSCLRPVDEDLSASGLWTTSLVAALAPMGRAVFRFRTAPWIRIWTLVCSILGLPIKLLDDGGHYRRCIPGRSAPISAVIPCSGAWHRSAGIPKSGPPSTSAPLPPANAARSGHGHVSVRFVLATRSCRVRMAQSMRRRCNSFGENPTTLGRARL